MIRYSMEMPVDLLKQFNRYGDLDFALAHRVLEDEAYRDFYATRSHARQLILDNSFHELGRPLKPIQLLKAAKLVRADYVISPDSLDQTLQNVAWLEETAQVFRAEPHSLGVVISGKTAHERAFYLQRALDHNVRMVGLPFRRDRLQWFLEHYRLIIAFPRIHLFGMNELNELRTFGHLVQEMNLAGVSVDTAKAVKWGLQGQDIRQLASLRNCSITNEALLRTTYNSLTAQQLNCIIQNITTIKEACR